MNDERKLGCWFVVIVLGVITLLTLLSLIRWM